MLTRLRRVHRLLVGTAAVAGMLLAAGTSLAVAGPATTARAVAAAEPVTHHDACGAAARGHARCLAVVDSDARGRALPRTAAAVQALQPYQAADLQDAYHLPSTTRGKNQTVAIVDAFDTPTAEADLAVYRSENGLPPCTTDNGCFAKVNQAGGDTLPPPDAGWALEASLDLDMASAACPNCKLLFVEATDNTLDNLGLAVDEAAALGANIISNSYGAPEYSGEAAADAYYDHPGVVITASSGDGGFGVSVPAAYANVVAVGGTSLSPSTTARGWSETAWPGDGAGCSAYITKPYWQKDRLCDNRTVADVAAVADPDTPVAVYDSYGNPGWIAVGGTSAASPFIAGVYALAGNGASIVPAAYAYSHRGKLNDVTVGSDGFCGNSYLCTARKGYDGPTGVGTPNGIGAF